MGELSVTLSLSLIWGSFIVDPISRLTRAGVNNVDEPNAALDMVFLM